MPKTFANGYNPHWLNYPLHLGVSLHELVAFAEPLYGYFDIDIPLLLQQNPDDLPAAERNEALALLDTAHLCMRFFSMNRHDREVHRSSIVQALAGPTPGPDDLILAHNLLDLLSEQPHVRQEDHTLPPGHAFLDVLNHYSSCAPADGTPLPSDMASPDDLAEFGQPLLENVLRTGELDKLDEVMLRVQSYWNLAQTSEACFDQELECITETFSGPGVSHSDIAREATLMMARYYELYRNGRHER